MPVITRTDYLEVNGTALSTPAYWITNLTAAMLSDSEVRGEDRLLPGTTGVRARKRRRTVTVKQFEMVIKGDVDNNGATNANPHTGLVTNTEFLKSNLGLAASSTDGTVTAIWHRPDTTTKTAAVHVVRFEVGELNKRATSLTAVLELSIPAGVFV